MMLLNDKASAILTTVLQICKSMDNNVLVLLK